MWFKPQILGKLSCYRKVLAIKGQYKGLGLSKATAIQNPPEGSGPPDNIPQLSLKCQNHMLHREGLRRPLALASCFQIMRSLNYLAACSSDSAVPGDSTKAE